MAKSDILDTYKGKTKSDENKLNQYVRGKTWYTADTGDSKEFSQNADGSGMQVSDLLVGGGGLHFLSLRKSSGEFERTFTSIQAEAPRN